MDWPQTTYRALEARRLTTTGTENSTENLTVLLSVIVGMLLPGNLYLLLLALPQKFLKQESFWSLKMRMIRGMESLHVKRVTKLGPLPFMCPLIQVI